MINYLKTVRKVDTYLPAREDMTAWQDAVKLVIAGGTWQKHTNRTARQIINTYRLYPEIEEDFRQMKNLQKLEYFRGTKYNYISSFLNSYSFMQNAR